MHNKEGGQHEDLSVEEAKKDVYNVQELKPPFIKVEDMSKKYRPLVRESIKKMAHECGGVHKVLLHGRRLKVTGVIIICY